MLCLYLYLLAVPVLDVEAEEEAGEHDAEGGQDGHGQEEAGRHHLRNLLFYNAVGRRVTI